MNKFSKTILLVSAILETFAGVFIILRPAIILNNGNSDASHIAVAKLYGIAAFTIGFLTYQIWKNFTWSQFERMCLLILMVFHLLVALQMYSYYASNIIINPGGAVLHGIFAFLFAFAILKDKNQFE
jgi:hypothetical protein